MDLTKVNDLEFEILKMMLNGVNNYQDKENGIEIEISSDNVVNITLDYMPYNNPFTGLKVFESKRISKGKFEFYVLGEYRTFDSERVMKNSVLYHMLCEYDMNLYIKLMVILFSNFGNNKINQLMKELDDDVVTRIKDFFVKSKNIYLEEDL
jgi:hypothetical protein